MQHTEAEHAMESQDMHDDNVDYDPSMYTEEGMIMER